MTVLSALWLGLLVAQAPPAVQGVQTATPRLTFPIDWEAMPMIPYRSAPAISPQMSQWVAAELARCNRPMPAAVDGRHILKVDVAVLLSSENIVRASIPRAIDCPMVEQYAAGLASSFARKNLLPRPGVEIGWYRASIVFDWPA